MFGRRLLSRRSATSDDATGRVPADAALALDIQLRQIERAVAAATGLIAGLTLSAALAAAVLLIGVQRSRAEAFFAVGLALYLVTLQRGVHEALHVIYSADGAKPSGVGRFHYHHIRQWCRPGCFIDEAIKMSERGTAREVWEQVWLAAGPAQRKAQHLAAATRWIGWNFSTLAVLILIRFLLATYYG